MKNIIIPLIVLFLSSCSGVDVTSQWDKKTDFRSFKTYSLYPWDTHNSKIVNDYDKQTIVNSVKSQMNSRGYQLVEKDGDLIVSTFVIIKDKTSYQAYTNHYGGWAGYGGGWGYYGGAGYYGYGWGPGYSATTVYQTDYQQGTLVIDIFRLEDKKLIWQGIGSGEVTQDYAQRDKNLPKNIGRIFHRFPIKPLSKKQLDNIGSE